MIHDNFASGHPRPLSVGFRSTMYSLRKSGPTKLEETRKTEKDRSRSKLHRPREESTNAC